MASLLRHHASILPISEPDMDKVLRVVHTKLMHPLVQIKEQCLEAMSKARTQVMAEYGR